MRIGPNQSRDKTRDTTIAPHRVIVPVYIPHEQDYYKDAFKIFKLCLSSIKKGSVAHTPITVVANGCSQDIHQQLLQLVPAGLIDELFIETDQLGKINSLRKAIAASDEPFLTITDGDVLFLEDWDTAVANVFTAFPKATAVAPVPIFKTFNQFASPIWFDYLFSGDIAFAKANDPQALEQFAQSIGWTSLEQHFKDAILTLTASNGLKAVVGCSHFCTTYRREVFKFAPNQPSQYVLSGDSERIYLDEPTIKNNGYRLSTASNHAHHLGNVWESWMDDRFNNIPQRDKTSVHWPAAETLKKSHIRYFLINKVFKKLTKQPRFYNWYLRKCALDPAIAHRFYLKTTTNA